MARLIALLCLAGWLMVTLPQIDCGKSSLGRFLGRSSGKSEAMKDIESIRAIATDDRKGRDWIKLAMACAKILKELSNQHDMSSEEAVSIVDDLRDSMNHLTDLKAEDLDLSKSWIKLLSLREKTRECNGDSVWNIVQHVRVHSRDPRQYNYVLYCFSDYLVKCGYEDQYKTLTNKIKEKRHHVYEPTLDGFLRKVFWSQDISTVLDLDIAPSKDLETETLEATLSLIADLHIFDRDYAEKMCESPEVRPKFEKLIDRSSKHGKHMWWIMNDYFAIYLQECGFEKLFKDAMTEHNIAIDTGNSPLASYLWGDFIKPLIFRDDYAPEILSALWILEHFHGKEFECSKDNTWSFYINLFDRRQKSRKDSKLIKFIDDIYANYKEACADEFKTKINELEESKNEALLFVRNYARQVEAEISHKFENSPRPSREMIGLILRKHASTAEQDELKHPESPSDIGASFTKLREECQNLWKSTEPYLYNLDLDFTPATKDDKIMKFIDDIAFCSYRSIDIEGMVRFLFIDLGAPYFPTKAQPTRPMYQPDVHEPFNYEQSL